MALGASAGDVRKGILCQPLGLAAMGIVIGVVAFWMLMRAPGGPRTFLGMFVTW